MLGNIRKWSERTWKLCPPAGTVLPHSVGSTNGGEIQLFILFCFSRFTSAYMELDSLKSSRVQVWRRGQIQVSFIASSSWCCNNRKLVLFLKGSSSFLDPPPPKKAFLLKTHVILLFFGFDFMFWAILKYQFMLCTGETVLANSLFKFVLILTSLSIIMTGNVNSIFTHY